MKLSLSKECGNSPKNKFVQDLAVALEVGDTEFLSSSITDDVGWDVVGSQRLEGIEDLLQRVSSAKPKFRSLEIDRVLSHGRSGAVNGNVIGPGKVRRAFCHVFEFSNTRGVAVRRITSYALNR